jgi:hypothetical protein
MGDDRRRVIYDGFDSVTHRHSDAWVRVADEFVALAFAGDACFVKCPCRECQNLIRLKKVEVSYHVFKHGFMPNYLVWHEHGEVETTIESDGDQDVDPELRMTWWMTLGMSTQNYEIIRLFQRM